MYCLSGCNTPEPMSDKAPILHDRGVSLATDKARYAPGENVIINITGDIPSTQLKIKHLGEIVEELSVTTNSITWLPPQQDYKGYMVELYDDSTEDGKLLATVGIDVSSSWTKFPRYGFLSKFPNLSETQTEAVIVNLNRHHINGLQFYDWHYKHHQPLAGSVASPASSWKDIIDRENFRSTITQYISQAHDRNMMTMFYNLVYGALENASSNGVSSAWYMYVNKSRSGIDKFTLPKPPFVSDILFIDPSNVAWQNYLNNENQKVYQAYDFDGYHMDQVGNRDKTLYTYSGDVIDLPKTFKPFIEAAKEAHPSKSAVMNAVNQYGQESISQAPVDFLYTEVWSPNESFKALAQVIKDNNAMSNFSKNTVLAAYINYDLAAQSGHFNTPSVLLADAVMFAFGASHLELGEHMLGKEYFPNDNLQMKDDLQNALVHYYDFLVAYQNLLRDGGSFNTIDVQTDNDELKMEAWPASNGSIAVIGKEFTDKQLIHIINFKDATTDQWRDPHGIQAEPKSIADVRVRIPSEKQIKKVWLASPDFNYGATQELVFDSSGGEISFVLPHLKYWDMIVLEY